MISLVNLRSNSNLKTTKYLHQSWTSSHKHHNQPRNKYGSKYLKNNRRSSSHSTFLELFSKQLTTIQTTTAMINNRTLISIKNRNSNLSRSTWNSPPTRQSNSTLELTFQAANLHMKISLQCLHLQATSQQYLQHLRQQMVTNSSSQAIRAKEQMIHSICFLD